MLRAASPAAFALVFTWGAGAVLAPAPASAEILTVFAEAHGGGAVGTATSGEQVIQDSAFFANVPHGAYGARIGAQLLFFEGAIQHHQFTDGSRIATWTQFELGLHGTVDLGDFKQQKAHEGGYVEFGLAGAFGVGTGQQVMPPLDNAQITDKAFLVAGRLGVGMHLGSVFDLGFVVPLSWGYFFKNGNGAAVNDVSTHYRGLQGEGLLVLRANIRVL